MSKPRESMFTRDRRMSHRLPKRLPVNLNLSILPENIEVTTNNISEGGMLLDMPVRKGIPLNNVLKNKSVLLEVDLNPQDSNFKSLSEVCWHKKEERNEAYQIGIRFKKVTTVQKRMISGYITNEIIKTFPDTVRKRIPAYILYSPEINITRIEKIFGSIVLFFASIYVKRQKSFLKEMDQLSKENVRKLYDYESRQYLYKHARTTHRKDDAWRLWLAQVLLTKIIKVNRLENRAANHLDVFAGTGLSYLSQAKVFYLNNALVNTRLVDYSSGMLKVSETATIPKLVESGYATFIPPDLAEEEKLHMRKNYSRTVEMYRGDATNLTLEHTGQVDDEELVKLESNYFDVVSIMFGLGGVSLDMAVSVSGELLKILKLGGVFATTDMHMPLEELAGRWGTPFPVEFRWPWFEREIYRKVTIPYVLNKVWGWHDTTLYPHLMKLAVIKEAGVWYGWEEVMFEVESQTWDFGFPVMPTYKQSLKKVKISEAEAQRRMYTVKFAVDNLYDRITLHLPLDDETNN